MAILEILQYPDPRLNTPRPAGRKDRCGAHASSSTTCRRPCTRPTASGSAATQVDVHKQIIVIDVSDDHSDLRVFVNPEVIAARGRCGQPGRLPVAARDLRQRRTRRERYRHGAGQERIALHVECLGHARRPASSTRWITCRARSSSTTCRSSSRTASAPSSRNASARRPDGRARVLARRLRGHAALRSSRARRDPRCGPRSSPRTHAAGPALGPRPA